MPYDITILTDRRYVDPVSPTPYTDNILLEDGLVRKALENKGLSVNRTHWDDTTFDWAQTKYALFRTTWDYFDRYDEFKYWLKNIRFKTSLINSYKLLRWNMSKWYLRDLYMEGIPIPPTRFIHRGNETPLKALLLETGWKEFILKPAVAGAARHTYRFSMNDLEMMEKIFLKLIRQEDFLLQEFQERIMDSGEVALILFGDIYSHAVLKKARPGDFRVQDDHGGTVHHYEASPDQIALALKAFRACPEIPLYGRVDIMLDNVGKWCVSELEIVEPELWFRFRPEAADLLASQIMEKYEADAF